MKETVLKPAHEALGARLVDFAGWSMPVQYPAGIREEAKIVRATGGLFDLGHMGRVAVNGPEAEAFLQKLQTNDASKIRPGRIRYAMILNDAGQTQDDILVYREPEGEGFFVVINAGNTDRDLAIMRDTAKGFDVTVEDLTDSLGMIALQGKVSEAVLQQLTDLDLSAMKYYTWARGKVYGVDAAVSRTGYTGEDGFEVYLPQDATLGLWDKLLEVGKEHGLAACGLGSRDILRLEAGMALYGHEINETTTPVDANLMWAVKFTHDFTGRAALEAQLATGDTPQVLVGLITESRRVPREGYDLYRGDRCIGKVVSGAASVTLQKNIASAYVDREFAEIGTEIEFAIRDKRETATIAALPFYKRNR